MTDRYKHQDFDDEQMELSLLIKDAAEDLEANIALYCVPSRAKSQALIKLEECVLWANYCIALHGVWDQIEEEC